MTTTYREDRTMPITEAEALAHLLKDGNLAVPCSRYGRDTESCAPIAWEVHKIMVSCHADDADTFDALDGLMGLVVNDHDDIGLMLGEHISAEHDGCNRLAELLDAEALLPWLEDVHGNGFADEGTGSVDAPDGHIYRVDRWTVRTDDRGFRLAEDHGSAERARAIFSAYEGAYADWLDDPTLDRDE